MSQPQELFQHRNLIRDQNQGARTRHALNRGPKVLRRANTSTRALAYAVCRHAHTHRNTPPDAQIHALKAENLFIFNLDIYFKQFNLVKHVRKVSVLTVSLYWYADIISIKSLIN